MTLNSSLSRKELFFYTLVWSSASIHSLFALYSAQEHMIKNGLVHTEKLWEVIPGYSFLGRFQDNSDVEFPMLTEHLTNSAAFFVIHFICSEILRSLKLSNLIPVFNALFSCCFVLYRYHSSVLALFLIQPFLYWFICSVLNSRKHIVWLVTVVLMLIINVLKDLDHYYDTVVDELGLKETDAYLILITLNWIQLKCLTLCFYGNKDTLKYMNKTDSLAKMLGHSLYYPTLFSGPLLMFRSYENSLDESNHGNLTLRLKTFGWNMMFFISYYFVISLYLHYIYFFAFLPHLQDMEFPTIALYGSGLWLGLHFYLKYVVSYGVACSFAYLDNIDTPPTPRCIARIHLYSDMWKYFDVGLYRFLIDHIYKPTLIFLNTEKGHSLAKKLLSSFVCFMFILLWHGTTKAIGIWITLNFIGIVLEKLGDEISHTEIYKKFRSNILVTEQNHDRFKAVLCIPLLFMSAFSNFFMFTDYEVGMYYVRRVLSDTKFNLFCVCFSLYCGSNLAIAIKHKGARKYTVYKNTTQNNKIN